MTKKTIHVEEFHTIVVGSGAAGLNAADRLCQYGVRDVVLVTECMEAGTSRNTGSDKQTYYKLSLAGGQEDSVRKLARVLYEGGCVDGDHALCEAALSCQGFFRLVELGVPFPHGRYGEYAGYKTDHDPNDRGTSVGPYTSRYMTEALERSVREKGIPLYDSHQVIRILTCENKVYGILCLDTVREEFVLIKCTNLVYATGGPAGIYADSVYPVSQLGASGIAFEAGVIGKNLTEWQYGLASVSPRWNVSGSYMQALPRFVSTEADGSDEREFLAEYYPSREKMLDMVFLKGYQWPFDAVKVSGGSSMIDLLVYRETCVRNRRVWLDYRSNPGGRDIDFDALSKEAEGYLKRAGACAQTPCERLRLLNAPAVSFYKEHGVDLKEQMLEVAVCAQHNNGGLSVDAWWQTNVEGFFAAGEVAGTHGICRPGGSALNAGQVGSTRAAEYIAAHKDHTSRWDNATEESMLRQAEACVVMGMRALEMPCDYKKCRESAAKEMSRFAAMLRSTEGMERMKKQLVGELEQYAMTQNTGAQSGEDSPVLSGAEEGDTGRLSEFYRYYDMRLCQRVYLEAMLYYRAREGKSRGSALYAEEPDRESGEAGEQILIPGLTAFSLDGPDGRAHQSEIQEIAYDARSGNCKNSVRPVRELSALPECGAFEVVWRLYREKEIYVQ